MYINLTTVVVVVAVTVVVVASCCCFLFYLLFILFRLFLPCDAMLCTVFGIVILSVRLSVCLSVCLSVRHTRGLCPHGSTYDHDFFTIW